MAVQLNDVGILVNNEVIAYTADSLSWKDGFGDAIMRNAVVGGDETEQVFAKDLETKSAMVKFAMPTTIESESLKRAWKVNDNLNVVELVGPTGSGFTKIFTLAAILADPESNAATDGNIEIEFKSNPAQ